LFSNNDEASAAAADYLRFPLVEVDIAGNNFTGELTSQLHIAGSLGLTRFNMEQNPLLSKNASFPMWLSSDGRAKHFFNDDAFWCPLYQAKDSLLIVNGDADYFQYQDCFCGKGYFGLPSLRCRECLKGSTCDGGQGFRIQSGFFPVSHAHSLLGIEKCPEPNRCSPNQEYPYNYNQSGVDFADFCADSYTGRLCSQCRSGFYETSLGCEPCGSLDGMLSPTLYASYSLVTGVLVLGFVFEPYFCAKYGIKAAAAILIAQFLILLVGIALSVVPQFGNWFLDGILVLLLVLIEESCDRFSLSSYADVVGHPKHYARFLTFRKILLFFLQATLIVNVEFWGHYPATKWIVFSVQFLNLQLRGFLACFSGFSRLAQTSWAPSLLILLTPLGLFLVTGLIVSFHSIISRFNQQDNGREQKSPAYLLMDTEEESEPESDRIEAKTEETRTFSPSLGDRLLSLFVRIMYQAYFEVCLVIFSSFKCSPDKVDVGTTYSEEFPWIACSSTHLHQVWSVAGPFLLLYVIGVPILIGVLLWSHQRKESARSRFFLSFIEENFRDGVLSYEVIWLIRRFLLALMVGILPEEFVSLGVVITLSACIGVQFFLRPFMSPIENGLDIISLLVLGCTHGQIPIMRSLQEPALRISLFVTVTVVNGLFLVILTAMLAFAAQKAFSTKRNLGRY
jgi:hypothetical protein